MIPLGLESNPRVFSNNEPKNRTFLAIITFLVRFLRITIAPWSKLTGNGIFVHMPAKKTKSKKTVTKKAKTVKQVENLVESSVSKVSDPLSSNVRLLRKKRFLVPLIVLVILALLGYIGYKYAFVAWVGSVPITRWDYYNKLDKEYGEKFKEQLITETLIMNEAKKRNVSVSDEEINSEIKKFEDEQGSPEKLDEFLSFQGITRDELKKQIKYQTLIKKMFGENINVSDEEVNKYIEENEAQLGEINDQTKNSVREQLKFDKTRQAFLDWFNTAKEDKSVVRF